MNIGSLNKFFEGSSDEIAALACVFVGLWTFVKINPDMGMKLVLVGTSYLFGKTMPRTG